MRRTGFMVASGVLLVLSAFASAQAPAFTPEQRAEGEALVKKAAQDIARTAREPSSVAFRRVFIQKRVKNGREPIVLCGEVNGKNGYGGFTGYQAFILMKGDTVHVGDMLGLNVAFLCKNQNPITDTRDYAPEMKATFDEAIGSSGAQP